MDKTKKIIAIVAACLVVLAGGLGVGYKIWFNEDMPTVVDGTVEVEDTTTVVTADTLVIDTVVAE